VLLLVIGEMLAAFWLNSRCNRNYSCDSWFAGKIGAPELERRLTVNMGP
jgi:hypothetical protein